MIDPVLTDDSDEPERIPIFHRVIQTPLVVFHDTMLLNAVRDTPSRARLTVNFLGRAGN